MFNVTLGSVPNPDFPHNMRGPTIPERAVDVVSLQAAAAVCGAFIAEHDLGGGNWIGGHVRDGSGAIVARVSYNGRIWPS